MIDKKHIRKVLSDLNPVVRQYHQNVIKYHTGIEPTKAHELDLEDSIHFLRHIWGSCLDWGNQSIDYVGRSVQELSCFLASFASKEEIHRPQVFLDRLEKYSGSKRITSASENDVLRLTELLQKFNSVRIKTAALIRTIECVDNFLARSIFQIGLGKREIASAKKQLWLLLILGEM